MLGNVQFYGEWERGGGEGVWLKTEELRHPNFQILPAAKSDGASTQAPGRPVGHSWGDSVIHWFEFIVGGEASKFSMLTMVTGRLDTDLIRRGTGKGGGGGLGRFARGNQEGVWRRDWKEAGGGASDHVGTSNVTGTIYGSRILYVTKYG